VLDAAAVQNSSKNAAHAGEGGWEEGKGRALPQRCKHGTLLDVRVLAYAHSSLTTPSSASANALPPPLHTIVLIDACCMQCRARGATAGRAQGLGRCTRTPCKHAWEHDVCPLLCPHLPPKHHSRQIWHQNSCAGRKRGRQRAPDVCT